MTVGRIWPLCKLSNMLSSTDSLKNLYVSKTCVNMGGFRGSEGEGGCLMIIPDRRASLASALAIWVVLGGRMVACWLCLLVAYLASMNQSMVM